MHTRMHTHAHKHIHTHTYSCTNTHIYTHTNTHAHTCAHAHAHKHTNTEWGSLSLSEFPVHFSFMLKIIIEENGYFCEYISGMTIYQICIY